MKTPWQRLLDWLRYPDERRIGKGSGPSAGRRYPFRLPWSNLASVRDLKSIGIINDKR
jgi:hypothetical protein